MFSAEMRIGYDIFGFLCAPAKISKIKFRVYDIREVWKKFVTHFGYSNRNAKRNIHLLEHPSPTGCTDGGISYKSIRFISQYYCYQDIAVYLNKC